MNGQDHMTPNTSACCAHALEIVGVNGVAPGPGEVLLRCTNLACRQWSRVPGPSLDVARVTTESLRAWRPYLRGTKPSRPSRPSEASRARDGTC